MWASARLRAHRCVMTRIYIRTQSPSSGLHLTQSADVCHNSRLTQNTVYKVGPMLDSEYDFIWGICPGSGGGRLRLMWGRYEATLCRILHLSWNAAAWDYPRLTQDAATWAQIWPCEST